MTPRGSANFVVAAGESESPNGRRHSVSLAHEIKNPLQSALNLLHLLKSELKSEQGFHYLVLLEQEFGRILQITHDELEQFKGSNKIEDTKIAALVESVLEIYRTNFEAKNIRISTRLRETIIPGYAGQLRQIVSNLLVNALDALSPGGRLTVRTSSAHEWNGHRRAGTRLTIADNGCGIEDRAIPQIFDRFFTTKGHGGTGLGLARVKDIVSKHDGTVRVRSTRRTGRSGTVFSIFLPSTHPS
jgi:two-component system CheB/CheR fusion protein